MTGDTLTAPDGDGQLLMTCPVCGADGADDQPVGPTVTVFCCDDCVSQVLRSFAGHADPPHAREPRVTPPAPATTWRPATA